MRAVETFICQCGVQRLGPGISAPGQRTPCPECGSQSLNIELRINEDVGLHDLLTGRTKDSRKTGRAARKIEFKVGSEYFRRDGCWHERQMYIDHERDWYDETITDLEIGEVVRDCHEPLSQHIGRGSARATDAG